MPNKKLHEKGSKIKIGILSEGPSNEEESGNSSSELRCDAPSL